MSGPEHTPWRYDPKSGRVWNHDGDESIALVSPPRGVLPPAEPGEALIEWQKRVRPQFAAYEAEKARRGQLLAAAPRLAAALKGLVTLKEAKDSGFTTGISESEYRERKERAWGAARAALREAGVES